MNNKQSTLPKPYELGFMQLAAVHRVIGLYEMKNKIVMF